MRLFFFSIFAAEFTHTMINYEDLVNQLKNRQFSPIYLLMGEEPFYIDRICKIFEETVIDEADRDFNQVVLYGKETSAAEVITQAKQFPFGSPCRLVILKEAKDMKTFDHLASYAQQPTNSTILVVCYKYGKLKANQYKPYDKNGIVFESVGVRDYDLPKWILKEASNFHFKLDPQTANLLSEHIGNDLSRIYNEFEKLQLILPPESVISPDIVERYIGISKEYNIFEMQEALGTRNYPKAFKIALNFGQHQKENPNVKTITMLFSFYHKLLSYRMSPTKDEKIFGKMAFKYVGYANKYTIPQLTRIISLLREYDMKVKGVNADLDPAELIKELIYKLLNA